MAALAVADVQQYTQGRLTSGSPETARLLAAGLAAARRYCGWHVTPEREEEELTIDGPGGRLLRLPTLRLVELVEVTELGTAIDIDDLYVSKLGMVTKKSGAYWSDKFGAIEVKLTHGFDEAPDFDAAVLSAIDRASLAPTGGAVKAVGPFQFDTQGTDAELAILDLYRLEPAP